jgi:hypothetical protein
MAIDWTDYRRLSRADKASRINQFDSEIEAIAKQQPGNDVISAATIEMTSWVLMLRALELKAAEIAEAILLCEVPFPYADFGGDGPYGNESGYRRGNEIIDRAMRMASQWSEGGYPDCFAMHDIGYTKLGRLDRLRAVAKATGCSEAFTAEIEAGALAAKAACDIHNFMVMTDDYADSAITEASQSSV